MHFALTTNRRLPSLNSKLQLHFVQSMSVFNWLRSFLFQFFFRRRNEPDAPNPNWQNMVNFGWFGKYGHGEGKHLKGWEQDISWDEIDRDLKKCKAHNVQVVRSFIFENLDGLEKIDGAWQISAIALESLRKLRELFQKHELKLEAVLFEFKNEEAQPFLRDFLKAEPFRPVVESFIAEMQQVLWAIDLHNEIDYLHIERGQSVETLEKTISAFRELVKAVSPKTPFTCSTGWRRGHWARKNQIGVDHLDFIEIHHYTHNHGSPWARGNRQSLRGLAQLEKPILLGEFKSDDFDLYVEECFRIGFLGAAPWSIHHDFPISESVWERIRDFKQELT